MALYNLDWDLRGRVQTVEIIDAQTNTVLDTRSVSSFTNGTYLVWDLNGNVNMRITKVSGVDAVVSGLFFGTVNSSNTAPILNLIGNMSVPEGGNLNFSIDATDQDAGDTLTYSVTGLPAGASFNPTTQTFGLDAKYRNKWNI